MSGKRQKSARREAKRFEGMMDSLARLDLRIPWYVRLFPWWRRRWMSRWEREHTDALKATTKRMSHMIADGQVPPI